MLSEGVAALVFDSGSGLFWLVTMHLTLCSLWSSPGVRCFASWPVWTRRTVTRRTVALIVASCSGTCKAGTAGCTLRSLLWFAGQDAVMAGM